jgi:2-amino-4-hydroxy-6-hydroxymethyldihydropteridine diphosphokinase
VAERAFIALGSNLGSRASYLASARAAISLIGDSRLLAASRVEETAPFGPVAQAPYLNQMVAIETALAASDLFSRLQAIEIALGRERTERWGPRTIDLDLVRYGSLVTRSGALTLPHPGIESRDFWQRELAELALTLARS